MPTSNFKNKIQVMSRGVVVSCSVCARGINVDETFCPCDHLSLCQSCLERSKNPASPLSIYCDACDKKVSVKRRTQETSSSSCCSTLAWMLVIFSIFALFAGFLALGQATHLTTNDIRSDLKELSISLTRVKVEVRGFVERIQELERFRERLQTIGRLRE